MTGPVEVQLPDAEATSRLAGLVAACLPPSLCIWLSGDLGSGKTHFARGLLRALGWQGPVRSPTYTLLETYEADPGRARSSPRSADIGKDHQKLEAESGLVLYHFDLYRMASPEEWADAGFDDLPDPAVRLIEWPERGGSLTPQADLHLVLNVAGSGRIVTVRVQTRAGEETWHKLESALQRQPAASALRWAPAC